MVPEELYRFRKTENLLDLYHELENEEIYFASPEELNDPLEGYRDVYWQGDSVVWKNFIINYARSLEYIFRLVSLLNDTKPVNEDDLPDLHCFVRRDIPRHQKQLTEEMIKGIFQIGFIKDLPSALARRKSQIRRNELFAYCQFLHPFILRTISAIYHAQGMIVQPMISTESLERLEPVMYEIAGLPLLLNQLEDQNQQIADGFLTITSLSSQAAIIEARKNYESNAIGPNQFFLIHEFTNKYIEKLIRDIYPDWYSASFLLDAKNSSIWGHYGDNHKGVCLVFKPVWQNKHPKIGLVREYGYSNNKGPDVGMCLHDFLPVEYQKRPTEIDFFRSIGRLTKSELNYLWYRDRDGNISTCGRHLVEDEDTWRDRYWDNFEESTTIKLNEWQNEKEYRIVIDGRFNDYSEPKKRKLKYDFSQLQGIIFGINTSVADKIRIMKMIDDKCRRDKRASFDFFQAYYDRESGQIATFKTNGFKSSVAQ